MKTNRPIAFLIVLGLLYSCKEKSNQKPIEPPMKKKTVVYQVFTRLFGNTNTTNKPWGTIAENGVGKFATPECPIMR